MQQIHNGNQQTITLNIYKQGQAVNADGDVYISIYDADDGTVIISPSASAKATNDPLDGEYSFEITPQYTSINRVIRIVWSYSLSSVSTSQTQYIEIVTPYVLISEIIDYYNIGAKPSDLNYRSEAEINMAEQIARTQINNYTMQDFGKRYGFQEIFGSGSDAIELTERMLNIDKVYENDNLVLDYTVDPAYNTFGFNVELTPTGKAIRIAADGTYGNTRYDNQVDPTILYYGKFRNYTRYKFVGEIGYNYVPQDIKLCATLLVGDLLADNAAWRTKYLKKVSLSEVSFELAGGAFNGTGNVIVDGILDEYRNIGIVVI